MFDESQACAYLAAIIDGEGHLSIRRRESIDRVVRVANTDWDILTAVVRCFNAIGIEPVINSMHQKLDDRHKLPCYEICIYGRRNFEIIHEKVPIQSSRKKAILDQIVSSYVYPVRPEREDLRHLYEDQGMTVEQVGDHFGVSGGTAYNWFVKHDIPRRHAGCRTQQKVR